MSIGIMLAWDGALMTVDAEKEAASHIAVQAERSLDAVRHDGGKFRQTISPVVQDEWQTTIRQLQAAIAVEDEATVWLSIEKLKWLAHECKIQPQRTMNRGQSRPHRPGAGWVIAIGPGYVRAGSPSLTPLSRLESPSAARELAILRSQLNAWTPQLKADSEEPDQQVVCLESVNQLDQIWGALER